MHKSCLNQSQPAHISPFFKDHASEDWTEFKVTAGIEPGLNANPNSGVTSNASRKTAVGGNATRGSGVEPCPVRVFTNFGLFYRFSMKFTMPRGVLARIKCLDTYPIINRVVEMKSSIWEGRNPSSSLNSTRISSGYLLSNPEEASRVPYRFKVKIFDHFGFWMNKFDEDLREKCVFW